MQLDGVGVPFPHSGAQMFVCSYLLSHLTVLYFCSPLFVRLNRVLLCASGSLGTLCMSSSLASNSEFCLLQFPMFWG